MTMSEYHERFQRLQRHVATQQDYDELVADWVQARINNRVDQQTFAIVMTTIERLWSANGT